MIEFLPNSCVSHFSPASLLLTDLVHWRRVRVSDYLMVGGPRVPLAAVAGVYFYQGRFLYRGLTRG